MKLINDYFCETCKTTTERYWDPKVDCPCKECGTIMKKKIAAALTNGNSAHGMLHRKVF